MEHVWTDHGKNYYLEKWSRWNFNLFWKKELISTKSQKFYIWTANIVDYGYFRPLPYGMVCVYIISLLPLNATERKKNAKRTYPERILKFGKCREMTLK